MNARPMWIDNHCHLDLDAVDSGVVANAAEAGVVGMISVGTDLASSTKALGLSTTSSSIWATAGVHPHDAKDGLDGLEDLIAAAIDGGGRLVAVGECGLDFHYDYSPRQEQRRVFAQQIQLAHRFDLPLVIHTRSAWEDTFDILDSEGVPRRTVFHCFTGGPGDATGAVERGAFISISGIVTFPSAADIREAIGVTPVERLMVETDSPYLAPVPHRGRPNVPANVALVGAAVADVLEISVGRFASQTFDTTVEFYGLEFDESNGTARDGLTADELSESLSEVERSAGFGASGAA